MISSVSVTQPKHNLREEPEALRPAGCRRRCNPSLCFIEECIRFVRVYVWTLYHTGASLVCVCECVCVLVRGNSV